MLSTLSSKLLSLIMVTRHSELVGDGTEEDEEEESTIKLDDEVLFDGLPNASVASTNRRLRATVVERSVNVMVMSNLMRMDCQTKVEVVAEFYTLKLGHTPYVPIYPYLYGENTDGEKRKMAVRGSG